MARITMAQVAEAVGVNKGTVSRALKGDSRISAETRQKIWDTAKSLGYQLDVVASGLSTRRTGMVGVVLERADVPFLGEFLSGVSGVLSRCKMELLFMEADGLTTSVSNVVRRLEGRKVDGLIWLGSPSHELETDVNVPFVSVNGRRQRDNCFCVELETGRSAKRIEMLAAGRPVIYRSGEDAVMPFLAELQRSRGQGEPFIIWDGLRQLPEKETPSLVCADIRLARWLNAVCLRYPARELGVLSARVLSNVLRENGVRPHITLVQPPLVSPSGELLVS